MTSRSLPGKKLWQWSSLLPYLPVLLAILVMLPRLISPQFGLFDDGRTLTTAQRMAGGEWYTGPDSLDGRFRPLHWMWFTFWYLIGGKNPFWFFAGNTLGLVIVSWGISSLVKRAGGKPWQAMLAGLFFVTSGPIAESYYTLKGEVPQAILMVLALLTMLLYKSTSNTTRRIAVFLLMAALLLCADLTKETSVVLLPISLVWYAWSRLNDQDKRKRAMLGAFALANLVAVPVYFLARSSTISLPVDAGQYTQRYAIDLGQILQSLLRWGGWLVRDFLWVVPLLLAAILLAAHRRRTASVLLFESSVWVLAWISLYLPWNFMAEYYMLPCAMGLAVFATALVSEILPKGLTGRWRKGVGWVSLCLGSLLFISAILNLVTNARVQLTMDRVNDQMRTYLIESTHQDSSLVFNIQDHNEYIDEIKVQLGTVFGRPDLKVEIFDPSIPLPESGSDLYLIAPNISNQPMLTVRMGVIEQWLHAWNDSLEVYIAANPGWELVFKVEGQMALRDVNYPRLFCPMVRTHSFCATPAPLLDTRSFSYGWTIYHLERP